MDDRAADDDQTAAALRPLLVVRDGLVGEDALVRVGDPGRARRREDDPVGHRRSADLPLREEEWVRRRPVHALRYALDPSGSNPCRACRFPIMLPG